MRRAFRGLDRGLLHGLSCGLLALVAAGAAGCWAHPAPAPAAEAAEALRGEPLPVPALHALAAAQAGPAGPANPLLLRESGLAGLALGATEAQARARFGEPDRVRRGAEGVWWDYDDADERLSLRLLWQGPPTRLAQIQAWPPTRALTRTLLRPLDPASRVARKYGAPARVLPWGRRDGGAEVWAYPAADVAFALTPPDAEGERAIAAVIVGL